MTKPQPLNPLYAAALLLGIASAAHGQALLSSEDWTYSQNFSSLSTSTNTTQTFNLAGWSLHSSGEGATTNYTPQWQTGISAGVFYHARNTAETNRSFLGGRTTSGLGNVSMGLQLQNNSGVTLTSFDLSFLASQFYKTGVAQQQRVYFSTNATSLTTGTWTQMASLTYTGPYITGNAAVSSAEEINSRVSLGITGQAIEWEPGENLWIRWTSYRDLPGSYSAGAAVLGITDVQFSAIPEPSTYALVFGIGAIGVAVLRRRIRG
jgi:hypothetical protein